LLENARAVARDSLYQGREKPRIPGGNHLGQRADFRRGGLFRCKLAPDFRSNFNALSSPISENASLIH